MNLLELFGAVNPLSGQSVPAQRGMADYLARTARGAAGIGERAFGASEERRAGGDYDAGPGIEAALTAMTGTAFGAPAGAMGAGPVRGGVSVRPYRAPDTLPMDARSSMVEPSAHNGLGASSNLAGRTNLPMDEASRMARKTSAGWDTDLYHGTAGEPVTEFKPDSLLKRTERDYFGASFTPDAREASYYATMRAGESPNVMPVVTKGDKIYNLSKFDEDMSLRNAKDARAFRKDLEGKGYGGIRFYDGEVKIFDPSLIRSRFAAFNPANEGSGYLLGAGPTDKSLGALMTGANVMSAPNPPRAPAGAMGAGPTRLTRVSDEVKPTARPGVTRRHLVYDAETPDGTIRSSATINGSTAHVQNIEALGPDGVALPVDQARGRFGTTTLRDLFTAFRSEHPEVQRIVGDRISGARLGGGYEPEAGVPFEMNLPASPAPPPVPSAAPREPGLAGFFRERGAGPAAPAVPPGATAGLDLDTLTRIANDLSVRQGGYGVIGIHDLVKATGLPREVVHQALLREAKAGNVGLHGTSRAYADYAPEEKADWINLPGWNESLVHLTVKNKEPQTWDDLQALFDATRGP